MLVDCYYRSRSSNVVWGYLRPQTTAAALAVPHPSPFSLLLLLPRLSRRCSCSFHVARWRRLGGRRCHCCIRIQSRSSPHCRRSPSPLPPRPSHSIPLLDRLIRRRCSLRSCSSSRPMTSMHVRKRRQSGSHFAHPRGGPVLPPVVSDVVDDDIKSVRAIIVAPAAANLYLFAPRKVGRSV